MAAVRYQIRFTGRVQGVGFRATTLTIARPLGIVGWVRNEPDGSVLCVAEGELAALEVFVDEVKREMARHLQRAEIETLPATGEFDEFEIRY